MKFSALMFGAVCSSHRAQICLETVQPTPAIARDRSVGDSIPIANIDAYSLPPYVSTVFSSSVVVSSRRNYRTEHKRFAGIYIGSHGSVAFADDPAAANLNPAEKLGNVTERINA